MLPPWKDPNRKVLSVEARDAMRDRLCTTTPRPGRPAAKKPMWLKQTLVDNKWTDGLVPWPEIPKAEKTEAMRHMYDRCAPLCVCLVTLCVRSVTETDGKLV